MCGIRFDDSLLRNIAKEKLFALVQDVYDTLYRTKATLSNGKGHRNRTQLEQIVYMLS